MEMLMKVNGSLMLNKGTEHYGLLKGMCMKESGVMTKCMEKESFNIQMEAVLKEFGTRGFKWKEVACIGMLMGMWRIRTRIK
jgi:hypothetical protein